MSNLCNLNIADFNIRIQSDDDFQLEEGYLPFLTDDVSDPDLNVNFHSGIPDYKFSKEDLLFEASSEIQKFYCIYRAEDGYAFEMFNQPRLNEIQQIAYLSADMKKWELYLDKDEIYPLKYPFGPIMLHYLTLTTDAVMMHASCAFDGEKGRIFSGFSGVGKSTMSRIWAESGSTIINDDRLIIRKKDDKYLVYNTPMYYKDLPKVTRLHNIFLISHAPFNRIQKIQGAIALSKVMAYSIQNNFDRDMITKRLAFFSDLCMEIGIYELGFVPDERVISFIREYENTGLQA